MGRNITPRQAALRFASQGHAVLPLNSINDAGACTCGRGDCPSPGKHPFATLAPHGAKDATTDMATVESWFAECYWLSYGIRTDTLFVVDVDIKHGGLETWHRLHSAPTHHLPHTWQVRTGGGGLHIFFKPLERARSGTLERGIDLRSVGAYVVGVGCKHVAGSTYQWLPQCNPGEAPLADIPTWLLSLIKTRTHVSNVIPMPEWRRLARSMVQEGDRHTVMLKLIGHLIGMGADAEIVRELMIGWNEARCDPPLPVADVLNMVANIHEREQAKHMWLGAPESSNA